MSCSSFRKGWEIGGPEGHAASCPRCAEWLAGQRRAASALARLAGSLDSAVVPEEREAELRAAFRQARQPAEKPHGRRWYWAVATTAACLVAVVGLAARGRVHPAPAVEVAAGPATTAAHSTAALDETERTAAAAPPASLPSARPPAARPHRQPPERRTPPTKAEIIPASVAVTTPPESLRTVAADDFSAANPVSPAGASQAPVAAPLQDAYADDHAFYPLVADPESGPLESGQIVRVQLRSDVLDAAGLAPRGVGSELVEAEVLVGPDGVARGIRLARPRR